MNILRVEAVSMPQNGFSRAVREHSPVSAQEVERERGRRRSVQVPWQSVSQLVDGERTGLVSRVFFNSP